MNFEPLLKEVGLEKAQVKAFANAPAPLGLIEAMEKENCLVEAVQCMAHLLPPRESVWWASQVIKNSQSADAEPEQKAAVLAAEQWAMQPTEDVRKRAADLIDIVGMDSAEGMVALAAKFSTGNMAEGVDADMPPPEKLYAKMSAGAVLMSMQQALPESDAFLSQALVIGKSALGAKKH